MYRREMTLLQPPAVLLEARSTCAAVSQGRASSLPDHTSSTVTTAALIKSRVQTDSRCSCRFGAIVQGSCCSCHYSPRKGIREPPLVAGNYRWVSLRFPLCWLSPELQMPEKRNKFIGFSNIFCGATLNMCAICKKKKKECQWTCHFTVQWRQDSAWYFTREMTDKCHLSPRCVSSCPPPHSWLRGALTSICSCGSSIPHREQLLPFKMQLFSFETIRLSYQVQTLGKMGRINPTKMQFTKREALGY